MLLSCTYVYMYNLTVHEWYVNGDISGSAIKNSCMFTEILNKIINPLINHTIR